MEYAEAMDWLMAATDYEKMSRVRYNADTFSLDRMCDLLERLGSPESGLPCVHVAGTKGKGSTAAMIHEIAGTCGLKAGLYTSPHLEDIRERIRVGRDMISPEDLAEALSACREPAEAPRAEGNGPTFFEIFTAAALLHFARQEVDLAVCEVGLGGRLDATNVVWPHVSVITSISMDHTFQLGHTLEAIAREKAGIIKPGVPVVCQPQPVEAMEVIDDACRAAGAPLWLVGRDIRVDWEPTTLDGRPGGSLHVTTPRATYEGVFLPLMGQHQAINAASAIGASELVPGLAETLSPPLVREALRQVRWPGRMEVLPGEPTMILDGAHNRSSVEALLGGLVNHYPNRKLVVVFGCGGDKDTEGMLSALSVSAAVRGVVFTATDNPRAADPAELHTDFRRLHGSGAEVARDPVEAVGRACERAGPGDLVVVCGSLYLVGAIRRKLRAGELPTDGGA